VTYILEQRKHLVVRFSLSAIEQELRWGNQGRTCVVRDEEANVGIVQHSSDTDQPGTASRHNGHILPRIFARLVLSMHLVVKMGNGLSQRLDTCRGAVLPAGYRDVERLGSLERSFDIIVDLLFPQERSACLSLAFQPNQSSAWSGRV
jgi:hypothetical protein